MSVNYTVEQVELMKTKYGSNPTRQTVEELAEELNKSVKSVIGKLSREGVYQKSVYKTSPNCLVFSISELIAKLLFS